MSFSLIQQEEGCVRTVGYCRRRVRVCREQNPGPTLSLWVNAASLPHHVTTQKFENLSRHKFTATPSHDLGQASEQRVPTKLPIMSLVSGEKVR